MINNDFYFAGGVFLKKRQKKSQHPSWLVKKYWKQCEQCRAFCGKPLTAEGQYG